LDFWNGRGDARVVAPFELARLAGPGRGDAERGIRERVHSREELLEAIRRWTAEHGRPPTWLDWDPGTARRRGQPERAERFERGAWPTTAMVRQQFGSLGAATAAAGLRPRRVAGRKANLTGPDQVLLAIREWTRRHGDPPAQTDLDPFRARRTGQPWRAERYLAGDWPSLPTVRHHFGTLTQAIREAGLEPAGQHETPDARSARRRRNRLALVDQLAGPQAAGGSAAVARSIRAVAQARASRDADALEVALLELSGAALGWADRVGRGGRPA
jgi:hypothetical protein